MLNFRKTMFSFMAVAAMTMVGLTSVQAAPQTAIAIAGGNTYAPNVFFSGGVAGALRIMTRDAFLKSKVGLGFDPSVTILFSPLIGTGFGGYTFNPITGVFDLVLDGGSFKIIDNKTSKLLLEGKFSYAVLHGANGSSSAGMTLLEDSVGYVTPLPFFPAALASSFGSLSVEFITTIPIIAGKEGLGGFKASDGITFSAP